MRVIQVLPTISYGDAVGNDVLAIHNVLTKYGYKTKVYAVNVGNRIPKEVAQPISKMPKLSDEDIVIYHFAIGTDLNYEWINYPGRKIMVYHNVTPPYFFNGYSCLSERLCKEGIAAREYLKDKVDLCLCDSAYNKAELDELEYTCDTKVVPILIPFNDYKQKPNEEILRKYEDDGVTNILFTGRIAPNKCQEDIMAAFYKYHTYYNVKSRLILVGNYNGLERYYDRLKTYAKELGIENSVIFTGHIKFDEILAYYTVADVFLCMSEHEGFCVPLVEAMNFKIPIVAYNSTAIEWTLGGSGFLLKNKNPLEAAAVIDYIVKNEEAREIMILDQMRRLKEFDHEVVEKQFIEILEDFIEDKNEK